MQYYTKSGGINKVDIKLYFLNPKHLHSHLFFQSWVLGCLGIIVVTSSSSSS